MNSDRGLVLGGFFAHLAIGAVLTLAVLGAGCAAFKADVKSVADVCTPQMATDVETVMPIVLQLVACEATGTDCSQVISTLRAQGLADAAACATAELHAATVKVAGGQ